MTCNNIETKPKCGSGRDARQRTAAALWHDQVLRATAENSMEQRHIIEEETAPRASLGVAFHYCRCRSSLSLPKCPSPVAQERPVPLRERLSSAESVEVIGVAVGLASTAAAAQMAANAQLKAVVAETEAFHESGALCLCLFICILFQADFFPIVE
jgi:hypothetical protein